MDDKAKPKTEGATTHYMGTFKMGDEEYEEIPQRAYIASDALVKAWEQLGKPTNPFSKSGTVLVGHVIKVWEKSWPKDAKKWYAMRKEYKDAELPISTQVKRKTGRSLASYPYPVWQMLTKIFPTIKFAERKTAIKMVKKWPVFQLANKV